MDPMDRDFCPPKKNTEAEIVEKPTLYKNWNVHLANDTGPNTERYSSSCQMQRNSWESLGKPTKTSPIPLHEILVG